jgi:hypothetical protein
MRPRMPTFFAGASLIFKFSSTVTINKYSIGQKTCADKKLARFSHQTGMVGHEGETFYNYMVVLHLVFMD